MPHGERFGLYLVGIRWVQYSEIGAKTMACLSALKAIWIVEVVCIVEA